MNRYALLAGINEYKDDSFGALRFAERDARELAQALEGTCGYRTRILVGEDAKRDALHEILEKGRLDERSPVFGSEDQFLFFFAGHGQLLMPGGRFVLHCHDAQPNSSGRSLPVGTVMDLLETNVPASQCICVLDACRNLGVEGAHDAGTFDAVGSRDIDRAVSKVATKKVQILFACREGERSWEDQEFEHGVLTHYMLEALRGCDRDRGLTFVGLMEEAAERMSGWRHSVHGAIQRPRFFGDPGRIELLSCSTTPDLQKAELGTASRSERTASKTTPAIAGPQKEKARRVPTTLRLRWEGAYSGFIVGTIVGVIAGLATVEVLAFLLGVNAARHIVCVLCGMGGGLALAIWGAIWPVRFFLLAGALLFSTIVGALLGPLLGLAAWKLLNLDASLLGTSALWGAIAGSSLGSMVGVKGYLVLWRHPDMAYLRFLQGIAHTRHGDCDHAIAALTEAIRLRKDYAGAYYHRGVAHHRKGQHDLAMRDCLKAIEIAPDSDHGQRAGVLLKTLDKELGKG